MSKRKFIKLDCDDIMEILLESYQERFEEGGCSKGIFLGTPDNELRFIAVFGEDEEIFDVDLRQIDQEMDYNGDHAFLKNNPKFYIQ